MFSHKTRALIEVYANAYAFFGLRADVFLGMDSFLFIYFSSSSLLVHVFSYGEEEHAISCQTSFHFSSIFPKKLDRNFRVLFQSYDTKHVLLQIYRQIGEKYGVEYSEIEILNRYRRAYAQPWGRSRIR